MFDKYKRIYPDINNPQFANQVNELEYLIYYSKSLKVIDTYDYNEDLFHGLYGNIYKLPSAPPKKYSKIPLLKFVADFKDTTNIPSYKQKIKSNLFTKQLFF